MTLPVPVRSTALGAAFASLCLLAACGEDTALGGAFRSAPAGSTAETVETESAGEAAPAPAAAPRRTDFAAYFNGLPVGERVEIDIAVAQRRATLFPRGGERQVVNCAGMGAAQIEAPARSQLRLTLPGEELRLVVVYGPPARAASVACEPAHGDAPAALRVRGAFTVEREQGEGGLTVTLRPAPR
ncbi:MAG: hypothetical protein KIS81_04890 [Maricaulaceae bacterium]|nr:hypothetical protein [Maricaulaceae bacterium]